MNWTKDKLMDWIYETETVEDKEYRETLIDEEFDCPIHGKLGGIDECPRC